MNDKQKKALQSLAAAAAYALLAFADEERAIEQPHAAKAAAPPPAKVAAPKPAKVEPPKEEPKPVVEAPKTGTGSVQAPAANGNGGDLQAQCRKAAKSYAEVYGREGLKEVLKKYTEGTLADVPPEKLPELLRDFSA